MIKLYHYSNKNFKGKIDPLYFGSNSYSRNSCRVSGVKRVYFYLDRSSREYYFNGCKYLYIAEVKGGLLYDINIDPLQLAGVGRDIFAEAKKRGYIGIIGNNGFGCAVIFKALKIKFQEVLTS